MSRFQVSPVGTRILVIGPSGSGKTTVARRLASILDLPFKSTDDAYWRLGWVPVPGDEVVDALLGASNDHWVIDGNFDGQRERLWSRADLIVWLDLPMALVLRRVIARNLGWFVSRRVVWAGNRMTLRRALSGIRHSRRSHGKKQREYPSWLSEVGVPVVRLRSPAEVKRWLISLDAESLEPYEVPEGR